MSVYMEPSLNRWVHRATIVAAALLTATVVGLGGYYVKNQYFRETTSPVSQNLQQLEAMVRAEPDNVQLRVAMGDTYIQAKKVPAAIEQYNQALRLDSKNAPALLGLGVAYTRTGDQENALAALEQFVALAETADAATVDRRLNIAHYEMGRIYLARGEVDSAVSALQKAIAIDRTDADAMVLLSRALSQKGDQAAAARAATIATKFVPDFADAYAAMAGAYDQLGAGDKAAYARAMQRWATGDREGAAGEMEALAGKLADFADYQMSLGIIYDTRGDKAKAVAAYQRTVELEPENQFALQRVQLLGQP